MPFDKKLFSTQRSGVLALAVCLAVPSPAQQAGRPIADSNDALVQGFLNPPSGARPRVWWHWMNGNITKEGITDDLEWMHRIGIAGFQNFDAALNTPKVVDKRLIYMTPEWKDAFKFAIEKGQQFGFEMAVAGSPGWSESGGPWVKPQQAMKKLTWSQTTVEGGKPFHGVLPPPPRQTGPIGNLAQHDLMGAMGGGEPPPAPVDFGADILVLALREPALEKPLSTLNPKVTTDSGTAVDATLLWNGDLNDDVRFPAAKPGGTSWLQYEFTQPVSVQAVTFTPGGPGDPLAQFAGETGNGPMLQSSTDGHTFTDIVRMPTAGAAQHTMSFAPVTARFFRLAYADKAPASNMQGDIDLSDFGGKPASGTPAHGVAEFALQAGPRVNRFEEKAAFAALPDLYSFATPEVAANAAIPKGDVIDLTSKMKPDGTLDWTPPAGRWTVLRMGYSLTGITNHPAPPEATGPEVDKLNRADVEAYFNHYLDNYKDATGGLMGKQGLRFVITDSWEAGTQNWTDDMLAEFQQRRGYDPRPWMPALAGRVVGSAADSDRFLWDYRRTIADLLAENHYGVISRLLHARGMGQYGESHEAGRATIGDGMEMKRADDVPMSAMWVQRPGVNAEQYGYNADIRESASVAHIYGQNLVAAESMTAAANPWGWSPATLKPTADKELAMGLNRFVIHSSVHQPLTAPGGADAGSPAPGLTLGPFGQWFNRNEIWAEQAAPWITYLARSSYLLQQGRFVADVAYFYGEDSNLTAIFGAKSPDVPTGYNFDYVNADILLHKLRVENGSLVTDSGMRYRVLMLDAYSAHMSLPVLRRLQSLVRDGAVVVGKAPVATPSLADDRTAFSSIVQELWGPTGSGTAFGKGRVIGNVAASEALAAANVSPDTTYTKAQPDTEILFVHRRTPESDLYFVDNRNAREEHTRATFAVSGKVPELWHPDTGMIEPASYESAGGKTTVPLSLEPYGTVFVVFRHSSTTASQVIPATHQTELGAVTGPWQVKFEEKRGEAETLSIDQLSSWSDSKDTGLRYFSGHATYSSQIQAPQTWFVPSDKVWLDLGDVANLAEVTVNGKLLGTVWKAPYRVDVSSALHPGANSLKVRVANLWVNRLIGDAQSDAVTKYTFTARNPYKAASPLVPAGLLGPVRVLQEGPAEAAHP